MLSSRNLGQVSLATVLFTSHSPSYIHTGGAALCSDVKLHLTHIDKRLARCLGFLQSLYLAHLLLSTHFIDLCHERVPQ